MDSKKALELARKAYPTNEILRTAYMLGLNKGWDLHEQTKENTDRKEEIQKASEKYVNHYYEAVGIDPKENETYVLISTNDFIEGVKWSDQHPRKGLWDSEKVCEWLEKHSHNYMLRHDDKDLSFLTFDSNRLVDNLKKAMGGE